MRHIPVLFNESIDSLNIKKDGIYVDLTLGRAGHTTEILKKLENGKLISFDKDSQAFQEVKADLEKWGDKIILIQSDFKNFTKELNNLNIYKVDGVLADLGVSSPQLDDAERGFSYNKDARLDMRMDQSQELDAHFVVNNYDEHDLVMIFRKYADVILPKRVAKAIVSNRPINTTLELRQLIINSLPSPVVRKKNPSKAVFQAIRIEVNNEIESLEKILVDVPKMLNKDGIFSIITFHSIEDKAVKKTFKKLSEDKSGKLPIESTNDFVAKTIKVSKKEIFDNKRSRSSKLRILKRIRTSK